MTDFTSVELDLRNRLKSAPLVRASRWQSIAAPQPMVELLNESFTLELMGEKRIQYYQELIKPNLPWAEDHFVKERVGGDPLNPGQEWRNWPYASSADKHRRDGDDPVFDHSYAERYWPKHANMSEGGILPSDNMPEIHKGIRFEYGDLDDLVSILANEPTTRQAYLPVWFPEDLAAARLGVRVPCSLGYHLICRNDRLHMVYYLRSCDFVRHFRDDVYMSIRLLLWVLEQCCLANTDVNWDAVWPGTFTMHITSLHCFESDVNFL